MECETAKHLANLFSKSDEKKIFTKCLAILAPPSCNAIFFSVRPKAKEIETEMKTVFENGKFRLIEKLA